MTRTELIAALEAATGPSRELDRAIHALEFPCDLFDGPSKDPVYLEPGGNMWLNVPHYTESIDAALSFTPEGMVLQSLLRRTQPEMGNRMWSATVHGYRLFRSNGQRTPALAICIANLRALETQEEA